MEKCASHSARAGESNASINGPVGLLRTQPPSVLSIHPHHIGFFENFAHTHTHGSVFRSTTIDGGKSTKIQKNVKKCAFDSAHRVGPGSVEFQFWVFFSLSTPKHPTHSLSTPHRVGWHPLDFAKMNKNRKNMKKCASHSARAGESNAIFSSRIGPILTKPLTLLRQIGFCSKTSHTHGVGFSVDNDRRWKINRNSEKCGKMCIRLGAQGWPEGCRVPDLGDFIDLRLRTSDSYCIHSTLSVQVVFHHRRLCKNE